MGAESASGLSGLLYAILGGGLSGFLLAVIAVIRKYKSGEIADDDAVIIRLDKDNRNLRLERDGLQVEADRLRRLVYDWQEQAATYRFQLVSSGKHPNDMTTWSSSERSNDDEQQQQPGSGS